MGVSSSRREYDEGNAGEKGTGGPGGPGVTGEGAKPEEEKLSENDANHKLAQEWKPFLQSFIDIKEIRKKIATIASKEDANKGDPDNIDPQSKELYKRTKFTKKFSFLVVKFLAFPVFKNSVS